MNYVTMISDTVSKLSGNSPVLAVFIWTHMNIKVVPLNLNNVLN